MPGLLEAAGRRSRPNPDRNHQIFKMFEFNVSSNPTLGTSPQQQPATSQDAQALTVQLLGQLVHGQQKQNQLLEDLIEQVGAVQKQRASEIGQWRDANPRLARRCRSAAEVLARVQTEYLETMTDEVSENSEHLMDGEFMLMEFIDRFGPRLAHLNSVLQVLSQLSAGEPANTQ